MYEVTHLYPDFLSNVDFQNAQHCQKYENNIKKKLSSERKEAEGLFHTYCSH